MSPDTRQGDYSGGLEPLFALLLEAALLLLTSLALPFYLLYSLTRPRLRCGLAERLGFGLWQSPEMQRADILIHAASVGEVNGIEPLLAELKSLHPEQKIVVSTTSVTGRDRARELVGETRAALLPLDHPSLQRLMLARVRPKMVIITETELWPSFLLLLATNNIPTLLINARISDYSFPNYSKLRFLLQPLLKTFRAILTQSVLDAERFRALGADSARVEVVGSTKYDRQVQALSTEERQSFASELGISLEKLCFVAGSVRPGEDEVVVQAYCEALQEVPDLQLILTPRHPERFDACAELLQANGLEFHRRSAGNAAKESAVVLLDTLGELQRVYSLASFSFVGATLVDIGGHNPLEPAAYGAPVLLGPYYSTVRDAVAALRQVDAVKIVENKAELRNAILHYAKNPDQRQAAGLRAEQAWRRNLGATKKVLEFLPLSATQAAENRRANAKSS